MSKKPIVLDDLTDEQLNWVVKNAPSELERREFIRDYALVVDINHRQLQTYAGVVETPGEAWEQPNPLHPASAYTKGATVTHEGDTYVSLIPMNMLPPTSRAWRKQLAE